MSFLLDSFDAKKVKNKMVEWIRNWFDKNGKDAKAIIGISGGKDSSVVAALCVEALGVDRVYGVLMPQGQQSDIDYSYDLCRYLDINFSKINIGFVVDELLQTISSDLCPVFRKDLSSQTKINTPARIRMTTLYAIAGTLNGRVANTCNLSEDFVGFATKYGDGAGDFSPLSELTVSEVKAIGRELGLPSKFVDKTPIDGLCGSTDEEALGFTYDVLDKYIRTGVCDNLETMSKIDIMYIKNRHKLETIPAYKLGK
jgi:NAD+ synthase